MYILRFAIDIKLIIQCVGLLDDRRLEELDVKQWLFKTSGLSELVCGEIAQIFLMNDIAGFVLLKLNHTHLSELGIKSFGVRVRILQAIEALVETGRSSCTAKGH